MTVSVKDVAAAAGVSAGTVSNALNHPERVAPETVERVRRAIRDLGYVRNDAARQLRAGRSRSVGLIVLDMRNPFYADVARGADARAEQDGLSVLVSDSARDGERERRLVDLFAEQRASGVIATPLTGDLEHFERLAERGVPVVLVDHEGDSDGLSTVSVDDRKGGRLATEHLLARGCTRIAFVGGPSGLRQVRDRFEGARAAASAAGAALERVEIDDLTVRHGRAAGEALLRRPTGRRPDGIFAANDLVAVGLLQALTMTGGVRVPDDIALVGYDDIDFAASTVVPLTSVRQPAELLGATAIELLAQEPGEHVRFEPQVVVRATA
ncbi:MULTISPECIES: LacI family DNA-binding transcriptional regulator [Microbacterium]|uniref:LacI family DNA-binding transcriptional regulator n=1 Tax=Microbacterium barkeri TaxID=33917 RepID=UPI0024AF2392|nr:LacI family DNA-binding transcriptional regulator [Microbacterium barkeri]MDI6943031.1 LacI family DNA-binding transcriptional regulator [Microbacterium barkeri]